MKNKQIIYSFIQNNKEIFNIKDLQNIIISQINEVKEVPTILNLNINNGKALFRKRA